MDEDAGYTYGQNLITSYQNYDPFGGDMPAREEITLGDPTAAIGGMGPPIVGGPGSSYETGEGLPGEEAAAGSQGGSGGTGNILPSGIANALKKLFVDEAGKINTGSLLGIGALLSMLNRGSGTPAPSGYQGTVPRFTAVRQRVPIPVDETRRPGSGGRRYFSDMQYAPTPSSSTNTSTEQANKSVPPATKETSTPKTDSFSDFYRSPEYANYVSSNADSIGTMDIYKSPHFGLISSGHSGRALDSAYKRYLGRTGTAPVFASAQSGPVAAAHGGLMTLAQGRYLGGPTDGMADKLPANIDGKQEARLSHGEFVIPADVVSHLGNGNSDAGAQRLYDMMDRIRKARTGTSKQGKQISPEKYMPK